MSSAVQGNTVCEAESEGLVHYPTTLAPVSGSVTVTTQWLTELAQLLLSCVLQVVPGQVFLSVNVTLDIEQSLLVGDRFVKVISALKELLLTFFQ